MKMKVFPLFQSLLVVLCLFSCRNKTDKIIHPVQDSDSVDVVDSVADIISDSDSRNSYYDQVVVPEPQTPPENLNPSAEIKNVWVEQYQDRLKVHVRFSVKNMLNKTGSLVLYVEKQHHEASSIDIDNSGYRNYAYQAIYKDCEWKDYTIDINYSDIVSTVGNSSPYYKLYVKIFDDNDNMLAVSGYVSFAINQ